MSALRFVMRGRGLFAILNRVLALAEWKLRRVAPASRPSLDRTYAADGSVTVSGALLETPNIEDGAAAPLASCFWPWLALNVDADGDVYPCPDARLREDRLPYGNVRTQSRDEIWNGRAFVATRKYLTGRLTPMEARVSAVPCTTCPWYGKHAN